jgi:hypothetical protein
MVMKKNLKFSQEQWSRCRHCSFTIIMAPNDPTCGPFFNHNNTDLQVNQKPICTHFYKFLPSIPC